MRRTNHYGTGARRGLAALAPLVIGGTAFVLGACGSKDKKEENLVGVGVGGEGGTGEGIIYTPSDDGGGVQTNETADCVEEVVRAETIPVDIYIMFDQSGSMLNAEGVGTRLDAVRAAAVNFLADTESSGLGVGIGYFGYLPIGQTSCDPAEYATPDVEIGTLPGAYDSLVASMNAVQAVGETPTGAALRGACWYTRTYKQQNPTHVVVNLLITDGVPEAPVTSIIGPEGGACNPTLEDAVAAAADCVTGEQAVPTYVLGVGPSLQNLTEIAAAGQTTSAYIVSSTETQGDVAAGVLEALRVIRGEAIIPCELGVPTPPSGDRIDHDLAIVRYTAGDGTETIIEKLQDVTYCTREGGWYFDATKERIILCSTTCSMVSGDTGGQVDYGLGCEGPITR